jgi:hypothetical protein
VKSTFKILLLYTLLFFISCKIHKKTSVNHISPAAKESAGGLGMTYKSESKSKPASMNTMVVDNNKKTGGGLGGPHLHSKKKKYKTKEGFHVFERSKKKQKPDLSLFPSGVSNKFRLKDRHTNEKKAARLLKKEQKLQAKNKKE